jgi:hypothetical protein
MPTIDRLMVLSHAYRATIDQLIFGPNHKNRFTEVEVAAIHGVSLGALEIARAWDKLDPVLQRATYMMILHDAGNSVNLADTGSRVKNGKASAKEP